MGSMYASVIFMGVQNSGSVQPVVSVERSVFYRERAAHMYSPLPYALGQVRAHWYSDSFIQRSIYMQLQELINLTERISNFVVRK
jgi:hypothetical protein